MHGRFDGRKKRKGTREQLERQRLQHKVKNEFKGALREIRKDSQFLARQHIKTILERSVDDTLFIDTCFFFSFRIYSLCLPCHFLYCVSASRLSFPVWVWLFWNPFLCHLLLLFFLLFFPFLVKLKNNSILLYLWTFALVNLQVQVKLSSGDFLLLFLLELCVNREVFRAIWSELLGCVSTGRCLEPYDQNC